GETHDSEADHAAQLEIVTALHGDDPKLAIGMEMFQRPFQAALDAYLAGEIDEAELRDRTEYEERWGFPWEYYAPLLRFARDRSLPVLALNAPAEATRKVSRGGLAKLTAAEQRHLPSLEEIDTSNRLHRDWVRDIFAQHDFTPDEETFERFYAAQVLWDETMADTVARFVREQPNYRVVVIAGQGHTIYGYGIPSRVARRLSDRATLEQRSVIFSEEATEDLTAELQTEPPIADYIWIHP
ncbi:MAG: ChaN family lipoprotein, partial [Cyanobacteria bacterium J06641_5]